MRFQCLLLSMFSTLVLGSSVAVADGTCAEFPQINRVLATARGGTMPADADIKSAMASAFSQTKTDSWQAQVCLRDALNSAPQRSALDKTILALLKEYQTDTQKAQQDKGFQTLPYTVKKDAPASPAQTLPYTIDPNNPPANHNVLLNETLDFSTGSR